MGSFEPPYRNGPDDGPGRIQKGLRRGLDDWRLGGYARLMSQPPTVTADQLRTAATNYASTAENVTELLAVRNTLIRQALANGWTHAMVADATGLSRGRINQISGGSKP